MSKEYTLDTDSGDTSETVVTYNADETVATEKVTTVTKEENAADKTDTETISYTYDSFGNVISQQSTSVDSENTETVSALVYTYDKLDRNVEIAKATGETQQEYMYNPLGDVIYEKSDSSETRTIYDDYSRVVQEITQEDYKSDLDGLKNDTASDTYSDISAHGQIGRGASILQHVFLSPKNKSLFAQADTVQGYMWSNSSRNGLIYVKGSVTRLLEAQRDTYEYLNEFIRLIGGKNKLK